MSRKSKKILSKPRVALVGDGQTERIYFANVKDTDRPPDLDLFPDLPAKSGSYKGVFNKALQLVEDYEYERVYALIDMDKVVSDGQHAEYNFEFWLLLHFMKTSKSFATCDDVITELRKAGRIPGYEKSQKFQVAAKLYAKYKDLIETNAIPGAKFLENNRPSDNKYFPRSEVYRFFEWYLDPKRIDLLRRQL